jgi:two-component system heavy metal sensor histidine kinase CusS
MIFKFGKSWSRPWSIVNQLTAWYTASLISLIFAATTYLYFSLSNNIEKQNLTLLDDRIEAIVTLLGSNSDGMVVIKRRVEIEWPSRQIEHIFIELAGSDGNILTKSPDIPLAVKEALRERIQSMSTRVKSGYFKIEGGNNKTYLSRIEKLDFKKNISNSTFALAAIDISPQQKILRGYKTNLLAVLSIAFLLSALLGRKLATLLFEPVRNITATAQRIQSSTLHERINDRQLPPELQILGRTMNEMLDRLSQSFEQLTRFSADIAHELRTPINNIQGEVEVALGLERNPEEYREVMVSVLEETSRLSKIIEGLLFLTKMEHSTLEQKRDAVRVREEVDNILNYYEASATEEGITIENNISYEILLTVEKTLFQRALTNLLSNAINYSSKGCKIILSSEVVESFIKISVCDNGMGISDAELPHVFKQFYRVDPSRKTTKLGGFGLGLAIVKSIMSLHKGKISIESESSIGTKVHLYFPT